MSNSHYRPSKSGMPVRFSFGGKTIRIMPVNWLQAISKGKSKIITNLEELKKFHTGTHIQYKDQYLMVGQISPGRFLVYHSPVIPNNPAIAGIEGMPSCDSAILDSFEELEDFIEQLTL